MKNLKSFFLPLISAGITAEIIVMTLKPIRVTRANAGIATSVVTKVSEGGMKDIVISLEDTRAVYFIDRGIERGLKTDSLSRRLLNKSVSVLYAKPGFFSRLSPVTDTRKIVEIRLRNKVIFSEL